jgi:hypothetical protein
MHFRISASIAGLVFAAALPAQDASVIRSETRVVLVDAVVTDKKGSYIADLAQKDFKLWEDGKEQVIKSFTFEADPSSPYANQKHYLVLFFDNSHMDAAGQIRARQAAGKFIDANGGPNRLMAVVNYSGTLEVTQNFTADVDRLKQVVSGVKFSTGPAFGNFGTRNSILALTTFAKNLADVPGRKILVLLTGGFPVTDQLMPDMTAAIAMCNRSNVAIYPIDVGGLATGMPDVSQPPGRGGRGGRGGMGGGGVPLAFNPLGSGRLGFPGVMVSGFQARGPSGGSAGGGATGGGSSGGSSGGGARGGGATGGSAGSPGVGRTPGGSTGNPGGGRTPGAGNSGSGSGRGSTTTGGGSSGNVPMNNNGRGYGNVIMPPMPPFAGANQQALYMLADGTGGFVIVNTNDLVTGMERILKEQDQFYLLSYTPPESPEGSCHALKVKVDRGGTTVRARSGYCNVKQADLLSGKPAEKTLEGLAEATRPGTIKASLALPFFFTGANTARVNLAVEIPPDAMKFEKVKGKQHAELNIMGIAYKPDNSVGARFSDTVKLDLDDKKAVEEFRKKPMHYDTQFDVASGEYNFKLVFAPAGSQEFGKIERPLAVEPFDGKEFAISDLAMSMDVKSVDNVDAGLEALLTEGRTPLIARNMKFTPTGETRFKATDNVLLYMEVYEPANTFDPQPKLGVQLKFIDVKTGQERMDSGMVEVSQYSTAGNPMVAVPLKVPVSALGAGDYRCDFTAVDSLGRKATRKMSFEVE